MLKHAASFTGELLQKGIRVQTFALKVGILADDVVFLSLGIERHKRSERLLRMARVRG